MKRSTQSSIDGPGRLATFLRFLERHLVFLIVADVAGILFLAYWYTHEDNILSVLRSLIYGVTP